MKTKRKSKFAEYLSAHIKDALQLAIEDVPLIDNEKVRRELLEHSTVELDCYGKEPLLTVDFGEVAEQKGVRLSVAVKSVLSMIDGSGETDMQRLTDAADAFDAQAKIIRAHAKRLEALV